MVVAYIDTCMAEVKLVYKINQWLETTKIKN